MMSKRRRKYLILKKRKRNTKYRLEYLTNLLMLVMCNVNILQIDINEFKLKISNKIYKNIDKQLVNK